MQKITVTLTNKEGLHARPASLLTKAVKGFKSEIYFYKNEEDSKKYQPKSILSVISAGAGMGDQLTFVAQGEDEEETIKAITECLDANLA